MDKKTIFIILGLVVVLLVGIGLNLFLDDNQEQVSLSEPKGSWVCKNGEWKKQGQPDAQKPEVGCVNGTPYFFNDGTSGLQVAYPESWKGVVEVEYLKEDQVGEKGKRIVKFGYEGEDGHEALVFFVSIYPSSKHLLSISSEPNNRPVLMSADNVFGVSQSLDMPFEEGSADYDKYLAMIEDMDEVIDTMVVIDKPFVRIKNIIKWDEQDRAEIQALVPEVYNVSGVDVLNREIEQAVASLISSFESQVDDWQDMEDELVDARSGLHVYFESASFFKDLVSLRLFVSDYFSGAAHPNSRSLSFNFKSTDSKVLQLDDVFSVDRKVYLEKLSGIVKQDIEKQYEQKGFGEFDEMWQKGVEAELENFDNFNLTVDSIIFNFDTYQVGSYAAGEFRVEILLEDLADVIG